MRTKFTWVLAFVTLVIVAIAVDVTGNRTVSHPSPSGVEQSAPSASIGSGQSPNMVLWEGLLPAISEILAPSIPYGQPIDRRQPLEIREAADVTGDGIPEAIVLTGAGGSASTYVALMRTVNGTPVVANLRARDGSLISGATLLESGSSRYGSSVTLAPESHAVIVGQYVLSGGYASPTVRNCEETAYVWNAATELFEANDLVSERISSEYCKDFKS